jgi:hypothetical protein
MWNIYNIWNTEGLLNAGGTYIWYAPAAYEHPELAYLESRNPFAQSVLKYVPKYMWPLVELYSNYMLDDLQHIFIIFIVNDEIILPNSIIYNTGFICDYLITDISDTVSRSLADIIVKAGLPDFCAVDF